MEENQKKPIPLWELRMSPLQRTLGWCYLPMHALILPALVLLYTEIGGRVVNEAAVNIAYYVLGIAVVAAASCLISAVNLIFLSTGCFSASAR